MGLIAALQYVEIRVGIRRTNLRNCRFSKTIPGTTALAYKFQMGLLIVNLTANETL